MRILAAALGLWLCAQAALAAPAVQRLSELVHLGEVITILREEGIAQGRELDAEFLNGRGGGHFEAQVADIFNETRMRETVEQAIGARLTASDLRACIAFYETGPGRRISSLELSARRAMSDPDIEAAARERARATPADDPLRRQVMAYLDITDAVVRNVTGAQSSGYAFYRGLAAGGGTDGDDQAYLNRMHHEAGSLSADELEWALRFHLLAYAPLTPEEIRANIDFFATPAGTALNDALFDGFEGMYEALYFRLGVAVAQAMRAADL